MGVVKVGATTWAERSLIASGWYPPHIKSAEARLRYYASQFPIVENDSAYWAIPDRDTVSRWAERTPPDFTMNVKANALLTGHYTDPRRLPKALRVALPPSLSDKRHLYPRDLPKAMLAEVAWTFRDALRPLYDSGKLGLVLFQFPVWFPISAANQRQIRDIRNFFSPYSVAIEFRNSTWMSEENRGETLGLLHEQGLTYTCVDEPQGFVSSVPPLAVATAELALVRLHGRNLARWQGSTGSAAERFEYSYAEGELRQWVPKIQSLASTAREVHVLFNNCHADYAVRNARELALLLDEPTRAEPRAPSS
jgi:uncharacterized protein YecE (DUF72 family)